MSEFAKMSRQRVDCCGLIVTCCSDKAVELFNQSLEATISWRTNCLPHVYRALEEESAFPLAHCLVACTWMVQFRASSDPKVASHLNAIQGFMEGEEVTEREKEHIRAVLAYSNGNLPQACLHWSNILIKNPLDVQAIKFAMLGYLAQGEMMRLRDMMASVVVHWNEDMPLCPYVLALYGFSLEENNQRDRAEKVCRRALELQPKTPQAVHAISHVIEEEHDASKGVEFLTSCRHHWSDTTRVNHITWHLCLYYLDLGQSDKVLKEYDTILEKSLSPDQLLLMIDCSSLLWRLQIIGVDPGEKRWKKVLDTYTSLMGRPMVTWYTCHLMMALSHGKLCESTARLALARQMIKSVEEYAESGISTDCDIATLLGVPVCNALLAYGEERYSEVVSLLLPLRYDLARVGGSWAQRQVFSVTLIQAAINAHQLPLALSLIASLKDQKPHSKYIQSLFQQIRTTLQEEKATIQT